MPQSQTRYLATARVGGRDLGAFQTCTGGRVTAESMTDRGPGAVYPRAAGGDRTIEPVTISRSVEITRDTDSLRGYLRAKVGIEDDVVVSRRPLDRNGAPYGKGTTWVGTLTSAPEEDSDTNAANEKAVFELVMQPSRVTP